MYSYLQLRVCVVIGQPSKKILVCNKYTSKFLMDTAFFVSLQTENRYSWKLWQRVTGGPRLPDQQLLTNIPQKAK